MDQPPPFTPAFYEQVNQGPLEAAYEEHNKDPQNWNRIPWGPLAVGVLIGLAFAFVNIYAALAVGIVVGGSFYVSYFIGVLLGWRPGTINYVGGASTGASQVAIGIAFVLPALFVLSDRAPDGALYAFDSLPSPIALTGFFLIGGLYGVLFFLFYRRLWLVERPLQYPAAFESTMELLGIAAADERADRNLARQSLFVVLVAAMVSAFVVLLRDLQVAGRSWLDDMFGGRYYSGGAIPDTQQFRPFYNGLFFLDPFFLAIGWFIRMRVALVLLAGAVFMHLLPFFSGENDPAALAGVWAANRTTLAAGTILGAGLFALWRLRGVIASGLGSFITPTGDRSAVLFTRRNVALAIVGGLFLAILLMILGGVPVVGAILAVLLGTLLIGVLGLIAVKVTGETSIQAVTPMVILSLLALVGLLQLVGYSGATLAILTLGAAAFFATGLVMSTDMLLDQKVAHYVGNPPHRQAIAQMVGLVPGVILATVVVWYVSGLIMDAQAAGETIALTAPFGHAFAGIVEAFSGGQIDWTLFLIAIALGVFVEMATRLGTAFGVGMVLQFFVPFTILIGAALRLGYELFFVPAEPRRATLGRVAAPTGVFVGASVAAVLVFLANQFLFT